MSDSMQDVLTARLQQRVAQLEAVRARAPETEAAIAQLRAVVPDDPNLPTALRQIVAAAEDSGIEIGSMATARPAEVDELVGLNSATLTMTATGSYFQLVDFVRRIEDPAITSRGIVFNNLAVAVEEAPILTISITGEMFAVLDPPPSPDDAAVVDTATTDDEASDDASPAPEEEGA